MRILICGGEGQLAREFRHYFERVRPHDTVWAASETELDVTRIASVEGAFERFRPEYVINTAAYHKVDECELDIQKTLRVNTYGSFLVADAARKRGAGLIFISSGYVFGGEKKTPYEEDDEPRPLNIYAHSKALAESLIRVVHPAAWIVRTNGLFGVYTNSQTKGGAGNFIDFVATSAKENKTIEMVSDQKITPTFTEDLVYACDVLLRGEGGGGIIHLTNSGEADWCEVATMIYHLLSSQGKVVPITSEQRNARAKRPKNALLANTRWVSLGNKPLPHWKDAVERYLSKKAYR